MRINVNIDDELFQKATNFSGLKTKKAVVEQALNFYVHMQAQQQIRQLRGKMPWGWDENTEEGQTDK
ncbi:MAG: type II toxin-antitoxin system VapB family antitoxin [Candidatus Parabeggiatoa sp. nov. 3]|jgi:Arc/MetJ family transcription regulator|nr:type II toxin-antitoxin system VapB family antitoxin [Candidatus Parabeggiatoa sp.]RKZ54630.1 MAG: type II toxin-antitoxin system VapB family antitoxin [Gammaproteobacteria bacterium]HIE01582.1 type II toxin-antitoxin system VapB family antitoxin [Thiotrichaceae bacterium]RKZ65469.1 MAG: type II toxin-antitoxin system VapB family antitoxin [Gammaproteobacteria bacterium]RKZ90210.1 MAG: type II toxin-antitoxin system VapB family antitoxin [Gammaproteobacteria bacterium]